MNFQELISRDMKTDLVAEIQSMDLSSCSNDEVVSLRIWANGVRETADFLTLEDEIVGHTYDNLHALTPKIALEETKRGMVLVKTINFRNNRSTTTK